MGRFDKLLPAALAAAALSGLAASPSFAADKPGRSGGYPTARDRYLDYS
jgi:hypothetical protein